MIDDKILKETIAEQIKKGALVAVTSCCNAPMPPKSFIIKKCNVCNTIKLESDIYFYTPELYEKSLKKNSN